MARKKNDEHANRFLVFFRLAVDSVPTASTRILGRVEWSCRTLSRRLVAMSWINSNTTVRAALEQTI